VSAIEITDVRKSFGKNEVLRGIDLEVAEHEVVCLIGASGSGKSTLLRCVNLLEPIDAGRIVVQGRRSPPAASTSTGSGAGSGSSSRRTTSSRT
jgi:ABC-type polar amino acid transport system ATPase subunit